MEDKLADEKRKKREVVIEKQPATVSVEEDRTETEETKTALKADVESEYKILGSIDNFVIIFFILRYWNREFWAERRRASSFAQWIWTGN